MSELRPRAAAAVGAGLLQRSLFRGGSAAAMAGGSLASGFAPGAAVEDGVPEELEADIVGLSGVGDVVLPVDIDFDGGEHGSRAGEASCSGGWGSSWAMMRLNSAIASASSSAAMSRSAKGS